MLCNTVLYHPLSLWINEPSLDVSVFFCISVHYISFWNMFIFHQWQFGFSPIILYYNWLHNDYISFRRTTLAGINMNATAALLISFILINLTMHNICSWKGFQNVFLCIDCHLRSKPVSRIWRLSAKTNTKPNNQSLFG